MKKIRMLTRRLRFERVQTVSVIVDIPEGMAEKDLAWWANHGHRSGSPLEVRSLFPPSADHTRTATLWKLTQRKR